MANSTVGAVLPPDIQYEESCSYVASTSTAAACSLQNDVTVVEVEARDAADNGNVAAASNDNAVPSTSSCTCALVPPRKGKSKRHSCSESITEDGRSRAGSSRNRLDQYASTSQDNNNLYPDPTAWCGDACESSSSSSPTYDQPTLSPSTSDSSSADADFPRLEHAGGVSFRTIPGRTGSGHRDSNNFEGSRHRDLPEEGSKGAPHFQKTLSNLKKFSLIKRKKKKRRVDRPAEISCSFVCQSVGDTIPTTQQAAFEDGIDLTARNSMENIARPLEAINPHIGHKLASSGLRSRSRPSTFGTIPGQAYRQASRRRDGPSFISYADVHCCGSVVTVSGGTIDGSCAACRNASSPDSNGESHTATRSLHRQGISRSGSICSETGERRHHRSAGSSPTIARSSNHHQHHPLDSTRFSDARYASSSHILTGRNHHRGDHHDLEEEDVRHIPVWVVNSVAVASRHEYDSRAMMRRSASGCMGESSRSVGDVSSPLDFRDSMLSSGSSWEACSHL